MQHITILPFLDFKNILSLQTLLLPNGLIPSRKITKFSKRTQRKFTSAVMKCRYLGLIANHIPPAI
ncbi:MAG: hypothetical protein ACKEQK_00010 [Candidatus Hodgkinia cicadicola]